MFSIPTRRSEDLFEEPTLGPTRRVVVKTVNAAGIGDTEAERLWESDPTEYGEIVRLDRTDDGRFWITFTDAEEFHGAYASVQVDLGDLIPLSRTVLDVSASMAPRRERS